MQDYVFITCFSIAFSIMANLLLLFYFMSSWYVSTVKLPLGLAIVFILNTQGSQWLLEILESL